MKRLVLQRALGLLCVIAGGWQETTVYGQTSSPNQPGQSPGKVLYQEVVVTQKSALRVQGLDSSFNLRYNVLSSLTIHQRNSGRLDVEQKVEAAKLLQADETTQALFSNLLQKLTGSTFTMVFDPDRELIRFEGAKDRPQAAAGPALGQSVVLASLIDQDGWKEFARYSFFQPRKPLRPGARWEKSMLHSWGSLGSWIGPVAFRYAGQQDGLQQIPYSFKLTYIPPKQEARGQPFPVSGASFKHEDSGGTIFFNPDKRRVSRVEERFHVKGQMNIEMLGQNLPVDLDEEQSFQVRLLEQDPRTQPAVDPGSYRYGPGAEGLGRSKATKPREPKAETD